MWKSSRAESSQEAEQPPVGWFQFCGSSDSRDTATWSIDARGGRHGIRWFQGDLAEVTLPAGDSRCWLSLEPVGQDPLPMLEEHFVRGDELHLWYPQQQSRYALRLMLRPVSVAAETLVLEIVLAIETDLLDSHPMIDAVSVGSEVHSLMEPRAASGSVGSPPITTSEKVTGRIAVLLGPHDSPFTSDLSGSDELRLRLFGEFLEKGVIRKARPWVVFRPSTEPWDETELRRLSQKLHESPLPLTT